MINAGIQVVLDARIDTSKLKAVVGLVHTNIPDTHVGAAIELRRVIGAGWNAAFDKLSAMVEFTGTD